MLGLYLLSKYKFQIVPAMEDAGARAYDFIHNDAGHKQDLPGHQLTRAALKDLVIRGGFPDPDLAVAIIMAESGGVPGAITDTRGSTNLPKGTIEEYSVGLFQINTLAHPSYSVDDLKDPEKNLIAALNISRGGTYWQPWSAYKNGHYKAYLPKGRSK